VIFDGTFARCCLAANNETTADDDRPGGRAMKRPMLLGLMAAGVLLAAAAGPAAAQAQKPWKHGIIAPKADAGFLLMAAKRGFAERGAARGEGRPDRPQGAAGRRARQL
jgi:hypothetical protein